VHETCASGYEQTLLACEQEPVFNERLLAIWVKTWLVVDLWY